MIRPRAVSYTHLYLLSTIIIDEFKRRTIFQLFSYPISKIKLLWGKILLVILISFIAHFSAHLVIQIFIRFMAVVTESSCIPVANQLINLAGITFGTVLIGLLPFVLGMIKHSTAITCLLYTSMHWLGTESDLLGI